MAITLDLRNSYGEGDDHSDIQAFVDQVADATPTLSITVANSAPADGNANFTIQVQDNNGNDLAGRFLVRVWWSVASAAGAPADIGDETISAGVEIQEVLNHAHYLIETDATGLIEMLVDMDSPAAIFAIGEIDGKIYSGTATITA